MSRPTPLATKLLNGNPGKRPLNLNEPTPARGRPACPAHIAGEAREEWNRICDELDQMGLLSTADRPALALYVKAWQRWVKAEQKVDEFGEIVAAPKTKTPMKNIWLNVANEAYFQVEKMLGHYGLTPSTRTRVHTIGNSTADDDDFSELR
jgi:P27 family predicted phage terminase small subunit